MMESEENNCISKENDAEISDMAEKMASECILDEPNAKSCDAVAVAANEDFPINENEKAPEITDSTESQEEVSSNMECSNTEKEVDSGETPLENAETNDASEISAGTLAAGTETELPSNETENSNDASKTTNNVDETETMDVESAPFETAETDEGPNTNGDSNEQENNENETNPLSPKSNVDINEDQDSKSSAGENPHENQNDIEMGESSNSNECNQDQDGTTLLNNDEKSPTDADGNALENETGEDGPSTQGEERETENMEVNDVDDAIEEQVVEPIEDHIEVEICCVENKQKCFVCKENKVAKYNFKKNYDGKEYVCTDKCYNRLKDVCANIETAAYFYKIIPFLQDDQSATTDVVKFNRKCKQCASKIVLLNGTCSWEAMDFCKEHCLYRYQLKYTKQCAECEKPVQYVQLGKYSVRFGSILRQFCSNRCLDARKKKIRICSYCQLSMVSTDISLGMKFFCTDICKQKYVHLMAPEKLPYIPQKETTFCYICADSSKTITREFSYDSNSYFFCGNECLTRFKLLHNFKHLNKCHNCFKYVVQSQLETFSLFYEGILHQFCSTTCQYIHIITHRRIISCVWCKVKKYNFDMIHKKGLMSGLVYACSLYCLNNLKAALDHITKKGKNCAQCTKEEATCDISTADGSTKSFCSNKCIAEYQSMSRKQETKADKGQMPLITSVCSLAEERPAGEKKIIFVHEEFPPQVANKMCMVRPMAIDEETQTIKKDTCDFGNDLPELENGLKLQVCPVPIYVPQPLNMWQCPLPRAVPFPLVVPIPVLIPLTRDYSTEYLKNLKVPKETVKAPRDPFEAELLMMAELVAAEKPKEELVEEPDDNSEDYVETGDGSFHEDVIQIALKMASDYPEPAVDLEGALTANTITPGQHSAMEITSSEDIIHTEPLTGHVRGSARGRGRGRGRGPGSRGGMGSRRGKVRPIPMTSVPLPEPTPPLPPQEPIEKPDANMCLKFTFGVNAWKQWVTTKNADLERSSRKLKLFKPDLLQMTADELNYSLCLFVNEVRKPNGAEYAPDTIYYLCLGIQQYLYENGRIDNIFCDSYYEKFTDCLDDVCAKFSSLYTDSHYIVTRVEEEHLWESKQLGAHSPYVLLTTLMFFNTKYFNLTCVEEHKQISFSHIMKHWKRNPGQSGGSSRQTPAAGRNVLLRFYPPQNPHEPNSRKRKVYEQMENEENPLRCPVKLYEFYLSKCPESVKTRNDVFYLMPERSCVPESPVWYSTMALDLKALNKMLHRVKMVKEINVALLTH